MDECVDVESDQKTKTNRFKNQDIDFKKQEPQREIPPLPLEMIIEIISYLDKTENLQSCMLLCKQIRALMFRTPRIMRNFEVRIDLDIVGFEDMPIIKKNGKFIRNLKIKLDLNDALEGFPYVLSKIPNLEVLEVNIKDLRTLVIPNCDLHDAKLLTDFLFRQAIMREPAVVKNYSNSNYFLEQDVKFKLTKYKSSYKHFGRKFQKMLENQAENLTELEFDVYLYFDTFNIIFTKCKKLKKLTVYFDWQFLIDDPSDWVLKSLKHLHAPSLSSVDFNIIYKRFPNLISLECSSMVPCEGTFSKLRTFTMSSSLDCQKLNKFKLPNLRNLRVKTVKGQMLKNFKRNFPKIENLTFTQDYSDFYTILRNLDYFNDLKTFKYLSNKWSKLHKRFMLFQIDFAEKRIVYDPWMFNLQFIRFLHARYDGFRFK